MVCVMMLFCMAEVGLRESFAGLCFACNEACRDLALCSSGVEVMTHVCYVDACLFARFTCLARAACLSIQACT